MALTEQEQSNLANDFAFSRLLSYTRLQWQNYIIGQHHALIAKYLEAVEAGIITRLMICMPPRHGKTMLTSEYFPAWYLGRNPDQQIIFCTYSQERSADVGKRVRNQMIDTSRFQAVFPRCKVAKDSKSVSKVGTTDGGNFFAVGIGSAITGRGANVLILDDVIKGQEEAESNLFRTKMKDWYQTTAYTRLMPKNAVIIINTRWHLDDLSGWLLREHPDENWVVLSLPAIAENENDLLKRRVGEPLWPEAYDLKRLFSIKSAIGTRAWNALYQQNPVGREGSIIQLEWLKHYTKTPDKFKRIVQSWDTAFKPKQVNDPSVCITFGETKSKTYVLDVFKKRLKYPDLKKAAIAQYEKWDPNVIICEDKASGQSLIQDLQDNSMVPIIPILPESDKLTRMSAQSGKIEAGRLYLPEKASWLVDYESELCNFPFGQFDDQVDATSQYLKYSSKPKYKRSKRASFWK